MALGRGLASLLGDRDEEDAEEALERIDSMRLIEGQDYHSQPRNTQSHSVNVIEEEDLDELASTPAPPPSKPLTTPLDPGAMPDEVLGVDREMKTMLALEQIPEDVREEAPPASVKAKPIQIEPAEASAEKWDRHEEKVQHIALGDIQINPFQPRRDFDPQEMEELKESIDQHGILQPLVVRRVAKEKYELIAGERRLRAAKELGWERVPAVVRAQVRGNESSLVYALIENLQREDLNPVEEALAYERLNTEFGMTHEEIGEAMGTSRVRITNAMRVLQLPAEIQRGLAEGKITAGHAKAILMIPDPEKQIRFYQHLVDEGLTVRKAELRARRIQRVMKVDDPMRSRGRRKRHALSVKFRPYLEERFGFNSDVKFLADKNRYEVVFRAYNDTEIQELLDRLLGRADLPQSDLDADVLAGGEEEMEDEE